MVLKKLGSELRQDFLEVVQYLGEEQGMRVMVEPHEYQSLVSQGILAQIPGWLHLPGHGC